MKQDFIDLPSENLRMARMNSLRRWLTHVLGLDRAIIFTILGRAWASAAGLVTLLLIARFLTPREQGYYYTFGSLVAIQIVFELGFSYVILQMASHERVHLTISSEYEVTGDPVAHARLASVLQRAVRWYSVAAGLFLAVLLPAGFWFFDHHEPAGTSVSWQWPWVITAFAAIWTFQLDPMLSFMEGCGFVPQVARLRFAQAGAGSVLAWLALVTHHGLLAPAMTILGTAATAFIWLARKRKLLLHLFRYPAGEHKVRWFKEVWHFQWRIAVSWICGYFLFQLFNPVLFAYWGPVTAGQMGMSVSLVNALQAVAVSWISTKSAPFGGMIACRNFAQLDHVFFRALWQAVCVFICGALLVWLGAIYINTIHLPFAQRLLSPALIGGLLITGMLNTFITAQALYLRAHKQEKFLLNSVIGAVLVTTSTFIFGRRFGAEGIVLSWLGIAVTFGLASANYVFFKYRRLWHA